jgi:hypothetical protein
MEPRLIPAAATLLATTLLATTDARAQEACVTEAKSDGFNFGYIPSRQTTLRNGRLEVYDSSNFADDDHDFDEAYSTVLVPMTAGSLEAVVTYDVLSGIAEAETWLFGYAEAGIALTMEVRSSTTGALLCSDTEELYVARYIQPPVAPTLGVRSLRCPLPDSTTSATISLEAHAWVTVGGAAGGQAGTSVQIVEFGIESCTASCSGRCGSSSSASGSGTCFCDEACSSYGDCCADVAELCITDSCWEQCDGASAGGTCYCDSLCTSYGDCCDDFADSCG